MLFTTPKELDWFKRHHLRSVDVPAFKSYKIEGTQADPLVATLFASDRPKLADGYTAVWFTSPGLITLATFPPLEAHTVHRTPSKIISVLL